MQFKDRWNGNYEHDRNSVGDERYVYAMKTVVKKDGVGDSCLKNQELDFEDRICEGIWQVF